MRASTSLLSLLLAPLAVAAPVTGPKTEEAKLKPVIDTNDTQFPFTANGREYYLQLTRSGGDREGQIPETPYLDLVEAFNVERRHDSGTTATVITDTVNYHGHSYHLIYDAHQGSYVSDLPEDDLDPILQNFFQFNANVRGPALFDVDLYTGRPGGAHGIVGNLAFRNL